mmetsp:Transcript_6105/g.6850  ORF Transcript_6105/g.6850 Transcript_6105/m.6850 type:complete len:106 (-) Transcript_6105:43-360(-)
MGRCVLRQRDPRHNLPPKRQNITDTESVVHVCRSQQRQGLCVSIITIHVPPMNRTRNEDDETTKTTPTPTISISSTTTTTRSFRHRVPYQMTKRERERKRLWRIS